MGDSYGDALRVRDEREQAKDKAEATARASFDLILHRVTDGIHLDGLTEDLEEYASSIEALADAQDNFDEVSGAWDEPDET